MESCGTRLAFLFLLFAINQTNLPVCSKNIGYSRRLHNIGPYRYHMLLAIADHMGEIEPDQPWDRSPVCQIVIGKAGGKPVSVKLIQGTGRAKSDKNLQNMIRAIKFEPLPRWFHGKSMSFVVPLHSESEVSHEVITPTHK